MRVSTGRDMGMVLSGWLSSIRRPNNVELYVNSKVSATWEIVWDGFRPFTPVRFRFDVGEHGMAFISQNLACLPSHRSPTVDAWGVRSPHGRY
jgi:hypothetical protein